MKKLSLTLAIALAATDVRAPEPPREIAPFIEGLVAGVVVGIATGIVIIIGVRQYRRSRDDISRPAWTYPPWVEPGVTNAPPATNIVKTIVLDADPAMPSYDASSLGLIDPHGGPVTNILETTLESSVDGTDWQADYRFTLWQSAGGTLLLTCNPAGQPVATNYNFGRFVYPNLLLARGEKRFYRCAGVSP